MEQIVKKRNKKKEKRAAAAQIWLTGRKLFTMFCNKNKNGNQIRKVGRIKKLNKKQC